MQPSRHQVRRTRALCGALLTTFVALAALLTGATASQADTTICEEFGSTTIQGRYVVQNNRWGTSTTQCISVTDSGFRVTRADGSVPTNGAPKSYPSVYNGCHYTNCSPGTNLPARLSSIASAPTSISYSYASGAAYDAAYDIWLDPAPRTDGVNRTEIMIWFDRVGSVQPVGSPVGSATVAGRQWQVWSGNNGGNDVLSFVAPSAIDSWNFDVMDFVRQTVSRGLAQDSWYLTSIQAGFEPWQNGAGLAVNSFSSTVNLGGGTPGGPGSPGGPAACKVSYGTSVWQDGFTAGVTVSNTGSSPVDGWKVGFALPSGQRITHSWNANVSPASGSVTADNAVHNASIAPGGQVSFGFQGTYSGTFTKPASFSLNGTSCTTA
ncbi:putative secreted cellulase B precursor [Streptomyces scabiei 87.22]|uniref:Putative secreted cellulase B n=1 Tax=Streptomyces scabiei (strain 87.22) TaxID=680198 RepID=C9Z9L5_STRSW|nr:cellulose binding domain-containing protein [Streptomyces scabiei]MDX2653491.1 cellulose binding domain-containing protein [Streptomyces scabiei]MDX2723169.1 cellulose binding domain-containing protein [Streptomyces scabiei]MDX2866422.1 cellulose binding domain-containing protein [Streptomyces scabiei]MDX2883746.1 cellulose binding domain-containing protein [Streptomyces scabiei]MDX2890432.1 cellulose binding domain-containing protein [Streptomyces scabiei]